MLVTVLYDYANLHYFMTTKELTRRQARWAELLSIYDFVIKHCLGLRNPTNALSCYPNYLEEDISACTLLPML